MDMAASPIAPIEAVADPLVLRPEEEEVQQDTSSKNATGFIFREMLAEDDAPTPSYDQLERYGLFDVTIRPDLLAEYRLKYPLQSGTSVSVPCPEDDEDSSPPRPSPLHRHSIAIAPSSLPGPSAHTPPLASPGLVPEPTKRSPFSLARRPSRDERPAHPRTKSTNDVLREVPVPPLLSPEQDSAPSDRRSSYGSIRPGDETPLSSQVSLDRDTTIKEKRTSAGPRKLRRSAAHKPALPVIRTDDEFLLRPSSEYFSRSPTPSSSPVSSRKSGWRTTLALSFSSPVSSPTSFEMPHDCPPRRARSPSPIGTFPTEVRREKVLPPVERQRKDSLSDSYFGDSENNRPKRDRTRSHTATSSAIPSPSSPVSTGNLWARALKLGKKGAGSRASSVASSSASTMSWDLLEGEQTEHRGTFEVLRKPPQAGVSSSRPMVRRTSSESGTLQATDSTRAAAVAGGLVAASTSSPNLSQIIEFPESMEQRFHPYSQSPPTSVDSLSRSPDFYTPPITASSSHTVLAPLDGTPLAPNHVQRVRSRSGLAATSSTEEESSSLGQSDLLSAPAPLLCNPLEPSRSRSDSTASTTFQSTRSSSQDSTFSGDDETQSSSAAELDEGDLTGATSASEDFAIHKPLVSLVSQTRSSAVHVPPR
ncbi:uncharacterized protein JCM15063_004899 [Sporobolomyces koalae]|uniref:uncharacterized protein n=1 Tax=Sporobolomyces koalae TaxID=500713 RepID=UPI0031746329